MATTKNTKKHKLNDSIDFDEFRNSNFGWQFHIICKCADEAKDNYETELKEAEDNKEDERLARIILKDIVLNLIIDDQTKDYVTNRCTLISSSAVKGKNNEK